MKPFVIEIIQEYVSQYSNDVPTIESNTYLKEDLCLDSLDMYELCFEIEEKRGVKIPDNIVPTFVRVNDIIDFVINEDLKKGNAESSIMSG
jgi:acyl carrier protein